MPLRRIAIFLSGVSFYERAALAKGSVKSVFCFREADVGDALKSLAVADDACTAPQFSYPAQGTREAVLSGLKVELAGNPSFCELMNSLRGAEVEISAREAIRGRIIGVEERQIAGIGGERATEAYLSLLALSSTGKSVFSSTKSGLGFSNSAASEEKSEEAPASEVRIVAVREIHAWRFSDKSLDEDMNKALDLLFSSRKGEVREITLSLPAPQEEEREASVCYVTGSPVWKATYRLNLGAGAPFLQAWAIVDNDTDEDWDDVELSLLAGKPSSFIQDLYSPYRVERETLPLPIEGSAKAHVFASGYGANEEADGAFAIEGAVLETGMAVPGTAPKRAMRALGAGARQSYESAKATEEGEQFAFALSRPLSLKRRSSAMLPLFSGEIKGEKSLVYPLSSPIGKAVHPVLAVEVENTSGGALPAAPVSVYDGGLYAGDALLKHLPAGQKRLISYGEDLSVTVSCDALLHGDAFSSASISSGTLKIVQKRVYELEYTIVSAASDQRRVIIEHAIHKGAKLVEPNSPIERTDSAYRFEAIVEAGKTAVFAVREEEPVSERLSLGNASFSEFEALAERQLPEEVQEAVKNASLLLSKLIRAKNSAAEQMGLISEEAKNQERIRANLSAVGAATSQGKKFLDQLEQSEKRIGNMQSSAASLAKAQKEAEEKYRSYVETLSI
jgi:hypothetical protein